ncbi:MAG: hypothetical protein QOK17_1406 [Sphingomonadales bacterium]|jgi:His-Xaa-Ser system radical SAM maturase HxsC|nr:hypothetical protein [Sphingomonadales bacterium]
MIPLSLPGRSDAIAPFVARLLANGAPTRERADASLLASDDALALFSGRHGLFEVCGVSAAALDGDVVLVTPAAGRVERLLRAGSSHNTLLVTERCDQLCVMCSQPPKKTHVDRFDVFTEACLLAERNIVINISGGEPTLFKEPLLRMVETVLTSREDLEFHILSNGQHFDTSDIERLRQPLYRRVQWGIPLYAADAALHDRIVDKPGAYERLQESLATLLLAGASVELRTVVLTENAAALPALARYVARQLGFIATWSVMQLENIGFARNRWGALYYDHRRDFGPLAAAIDEAVLGRIAVRLFNFARCSVPPAYRRYAVASISDWKRRYAPACDGCREKDQCSGFFEWHPTEDATAGVEPL